ncbi:MAG: alkane 1-monooxygenase [Paracoccaceae bacterium]
MNNSVPEDDDATMRAIKSTLASLGDDDPRDARSSPDRQKPAPRLRVVTPASETAPTESATSAEAAVTTILTTDDTPVEKPRRKRKTVKEGPPLRDVLAAAWARWHPLRPFLIATLGPVPFLLLAAGLGGIWSLLALLAMTAIVHGIDEFAARRGIEASDGAPAEMADRLSVVLAGLHFALLIVAVWSLSGAAGLGFFSWLATFLAFGLWFGQVSNSNAHELIHRTDKRLFRTGMWVYISLLFGHHTSAHRLVHHRFVATLDDPNTAVEGESFYLFAARAWPGAFVAGYEMEENLREARGSSGLRNLNPYTIYLAGAALCAGLVIILFGFSGLIAYLLLCAYAQVQLLLSDYVQHYGLQRRNLPSGNPEPAGPQHSWDAPHPASGFMMLNAPRHADHHAHPTRRYPELKVSPGGRAPLLPYSLPVMATIALVPSAWHRIMDRRLKTLKQLA